MTMLQKNDDVVAAQPQIFQSFTHIQIPLQLYRKISDYLKLKYTYNQNAINLNESKEIEFIINSGLIAATTALHSNNSPLLHKEKPPRRDVWVNLGKIGMEFLNCNSYPIIPSSYLSAILNKALENMDSRVIRDYRKTVLLYCNIHEQIIDKCSDSKLGDLDVSFFIQLIPKQYLATSSTSSFMHERD